MVYEAAQADPLLLHAQPCTHDLQSPNPENLCKSLNPKQTLQGRNPIPPIMQEWRERVWRRKHPDARAVPPRLFTVGRLGRSPHCCPCFVYNVVNSAPSGRRAAVQTLRTSANAPSWQPGKDTLQQ